MESVTVVTKCDVCGKDIVVIKEAIGDLCVLALCTVCAREPVSTVSPEGGDFWEHYSHPFESKVVGVRVSTRLEL